MKTMLMLAAMAGFCLGAEPEVSEKGGMFEGVERIETADGKVYEGVRSVKVTPAYVTVMHEEGSARIYWEKMPEGMRTAYGYDREKALEFLKLELTKRGAAQAALEKDSAAAAKVAAARNNARKEKEHRAKMDAFWAAWDRDNPAVRLAPARPVGSLQQSNVNEWANYYLFNPRAQEYAGPLGSGKFLGR